MDFLPNFFIKPVEIFCKKLFFGKEVADWLNKIFAVTKDCFNTTQSTIKLTSIQASLENNKKHVYNNFLVENKKLKPKIKLKDLVQTADKKTTKLIQKFEDLGYKQTQNFINRHTV